MQINPTLEKLQAPKKVGIIGAGPTGLATAIAIKNQGMEVHVVIKLGNFDP